MLDIILAFIVCRSAPASPGIGIRDYRSLISLSSVQLSPNGSKIALVESVPDFSTNTKKTSLLVIDSKNGFLQTLTDGRVSVSSPRWSPAGDKIAYISSGSEHQDEVFVLRLQERTAHQVTHAPNGVEQFSWSPKGDRIAYVSQEGAANSNASFEIRNVGVRTDSAPLSSHLFVVSADGGNVRQITHGFWSILETVGPFVGAAADPSWSPDGKRIVFARQVNPDNGDSDLSTIASAEVATGRVKTLTRAKSYEYQPVCSPTSDAIAYLYPHGPTPLSVMDAFTVSANAAPINRTAALDRDLTSVAWTPDGKSLLISGNDRVSIKIWRQPLAGPASAYPLGDLQPTEFSPAKDGSLALIATTSMRAPELYFYDAHSQRTRRLTDFNEKLRGFALGAVTEFRWTAPDGEHNDGVLTYPRSARPGQKLPLVVFIHGGPEAAATRQFNGFEGDLLRQTLAARGYLVLEPNYRGSDNLGNRHEHGIYRNPAEGPASDILAGVDALIAKGLADRRHISVAGHSYGGYMTSWLITHDHRWRSAIVADGVVDWTQEYCLSSSGNLAWTRDSLGGGPWDPASSSLYRRFSPINFVSQVATPTLILSGTADDQVPVSESYMLYHALKDRGIPVRFLGFPLSKHTPDDPLKYEKFYEAMEGWIVQHDPPAK